MVYKLNGVNISPQLNNCKNGFNGAPPGGIFDRRDKIDDWKSSIFNIQYSIFGGGVINVRSFKMEFNKA